MSTPSTGRMIDVETMAMTAGVVDDRVRNRLVVCAERSEAELIYRRDETYLYLVHTAVPLALRGRHLGDALVRAAIVLAHDEDLRIAPWCPFARRWLRTHPDEAAGADIDWESRPPAPG